MDLFILIIWYEEYDVVYELFVFFLWKLVMFELLWDFRWVFDGIFRGKVSIV